MLNIFKKEKSSPRKLRWDQVANIIFIGLTLWIISANSGSANTMMRSLINDMQNNIMNMINWNG